jgi:hypothetical protein
MPVCFKTHLQQSTVQNKFRRRNPWTPVQRAAASDAAVEAGGGGVRRVRRVKRGLGNGWELTGGRRGKEKMEGNGREEGKGKGGRVGKGKGLEPGALAPSQIR